MDPHDPYAPPESDWEPFRVKGYAGVRDTRKLLSKTALSEEELRYLRSRYRGEIRQNDRAFGALVAGLRSRRLLESSVVIFTSDHGEEFLDHAGLMHRRTLYQEVLRVPFAVRLPGGRNAGQVIDHPFRQIDLLPTLAGLVGAPAPEGVEGVDLSGVWLGRNVSPEHPEPMAQVLFKELRKYSIRSGDFKLIVNDDLRPYWRAGTALELYDVRNDPGERFNLVDQRPITARYLEVRLNRMRAEQEAKRSRWEKDSQRPLSTAEIEKLRALGYVE